MRASILVLGRLLGGSGTLTCRRRVGGDRRAARESARLGVRAMGASISSTTATFARGHEVKGARIVLDTVTVMGTENLMMAAVCADGETVTENAAREPEIGDSRSDGNGAKIEGARSAQH